MTSALPTVLLYNPITDHYTLPLALLSLASTIDAEKVEPRIVDGRLVEDIEALLRAEVGNALCLGITVLTGPSIRDALFVSRLAKSLRPDLPVVWGGWHPSLKPKDCLASPAVDVVVRGQGEQTFAEVTRRFLVGESLQACLGTSYRLSDDTIVTNPDRPMFPIASLRPLDFESLDLESYFEAKGLRQLDHVVSVGCPFACAHCADPLVYGGQYTARPPREVAQRLLALHERIGFVDVNFQDETLYLSGKDLLAFASTLCDGGSAFTWAATMRADLALKLEPGSFALFARSGLRRLNVGVESGDPEIMRALKPGMSVQAAVALAERCNAHRIVGRYSFMVGFPRETQASVVRTLELAERLRSMSPLNKTPVFFFRPMPGCTLPAALGGDELSMPEGLQAFCDFDFVNEPAPWVNSKTVERVRLFNAGE